MTFLNKEPAQKTAALQLIRGYDENNEPVYAYVFGETSYLRQANEFSQRSIIDISEKATVLCKGPGHKVPEGIEVYVMQELDKLLKKIG
jgi:hypothetical protein